MKPSKPKLDLCPEGFHWTAPNGYKLSIQWGTGNYCHSEIATDIPSEWFTHSTGNLTSRDFEMALFCPDGDFVPLLDDDVEGYVPAACLPDIMQAVATGDIVKILDVLAEAKWEKDK